MKNRYYFFKRIYKDFVIIFDYNGIRKTMSYDKKLMKFIRKKDINYIVVYNDFSVSIRRCKVNNYRKYLIKVFLEDLFLGNLG